MRVLFLTHRLPFSPNRGDRIRAHHLVRVLSRVADVHLVALAHDADEWSHRNDLKDLTASLDVVRVSRWRRLTAAGLALAGRRPLTHVLLHDRSMNDVLRRRLAASPPDVVLAYCSGMARYACEPVLEQVPFVFDLVDVDSQKWRQLAARSTGPLSWVYRREARLLEQFEATAIRRAAASTVVSERERGQLAPTLGQAVSVVQNGIDVESFRPQQPPATEPRVVFCGVFNYAPNERAALWLARQVWPLVLQTHPDARLTLVGMHPTAAVERLAADPTIEVTGGVPDVRPFLWRSAVGVAPLDIARGVQNKVLEAVAAGLPSVITRAVADGLPEAVLDACVVADDAAAFAEAIVELLSRSPDDRRRLAARGDLTALGWERQLQPMVELLRLAADGRHPQPGSSDQQQGQ